MVDYEDEDQLYYWRTRRQAQQSANDGQLAYGALDAVVQFEPDKGWVVVLYAERNIPEAWAAGYELQTPASHKAEIFQNERCRAAEKKAARSRAVSAAPKGSDSQTRRRIDVQTVAPGTVTPPWVR